MPQRNHVSNLTEEEKLKLQIQQEQDLACLQRQYNVLERERELYNTDHSLGHRINKILTVYQTELHNISVDLGVASAPAKKRNDIQVSNHLSKILADHEFYEDEIAKERQYLQEIDGQIKSVEKEVVQLRSVQITDKQHEERVWAAMVTVDGLMNKLDIQNKKFGSFCAKNQQLRLRIERKLWERDVFMKIWKKLIMKLSMGKKFMIDLIEQATIAYDQREEWCSRLQALRIKGHYDFISQTQHMRELRTKQDNNIKLETFFNIKGRKRVMRDLVAKKRQARAERQARMKERLTNYKSYMKDIYEFTKEKKMDVIAKKYFLQEAENFSLFTHINDMLEEMELLGDNLEKMQTNITNLNQTKATRIQKRQATLEDMQCQLVTAIKDVHNSEKQLASGKAYIRSMLAGIEKLFKICRCDKDPILKLLGNDSGITVYNVFLYLDMIEHVINKALVVIYNNEKHAFDRKKILNQQRIVADDHVPREVKSFDKMVPTTPCPLCLQRELVSDVVDIPQMVMTREQVKESLQERLKSPEYLGMIHNVSKCFLPESREIIQRRYQ